MDESEILDGIMDDSRTFAQTVEGEVDNFPTEVDHHPLMAMYVGWNLGRLQGRAVGQLINQKITVEEVFDHLYHAEMISHDSQQEFGITESIDESIRELAENHSDSDEIVDAAYLADLAEMIGNWIDDYSSEMGEMDFVSIADKGLIDTRKVFRSPESIFEDSVWSWMDDHPKQDIRHACKTLVLDMPTASSFLSLRVVEYCLREWYHAQTGERIENTAWGGVTEKIESEFDSDSEKPAVLSNLDYLREKRNGIAHPDDSPSWEEAEDTLLNVRRTVTEIHKELS